MESLTNIQLFKELDPEVAKKHSPTCIWRNHGPHELIIDTDDSSDDVRFIVSGKVRIIIRIATGKEIILGEMEDGEFFGEIAAIDSECRSANVTTLTNTQICTMPSKLFLEIICNCSKTNISVLQVLTKRIRQLNEKIAEHSFLQAKHRLYAELMRMSKRRPANPEQRTITPPPVQRDLAERIGSRREVVSRELCILQRQGILEKTRGALVLSNVAELQRKISSALNA